MKKMRAPALRTTTQPLRDVVRGLKGKDCIAIADSFNFPKVRDIVETVHVTDNGQEQIGRIRAEEYSRVIAIGGCTALDVGRACAKGGLTAIPTILSTDCISVDNSILRDGEGKQRCIRTVAPDETVISLPALMDAGHDDLARWTSSGFGDLFANIGAALDQDRQADGKSGASLLWLGQALPEIDRILGWVVGSFDGFGKETLGRLAAWCHNASIRIMETRRKPGGEHMLYYSMKEMQGYPNRRPTHGQLVAAGTLLTIRMAAARTGNFSLYRRLKEAYGRLGLPTDYAGLEGIGVDKEHLVAGLACLKDTGTLLGDQSDAAMLVDQTFGERTRRTERPNFTKDGLGKAIDEIRARHGKSYREVAKDIQERIRGYWEASGEAPIVLGLSGGIDSTVAAHLTAAAIGSENIIAITAPAWDGDPCVGMSGLVRRHLGIERGGVVHVGRIAERIARDVEGLTGMVSGDKGVWHGNIGSRVRVNYLYAVANAVGGRVLGTGNRTEQVQGYATKYGTPNSCDFGVLDELYKTDIYGLAEALGVPRAIIEQTPTTGFYRGQTHEMELGATLEEQDAAAFLLFERKMPIGEIVECYGASRAFLERMLRRYEASMHKRMLRQEHVELGGIH